jgi:hypothetical protein
MDFRAQYEFLYFHLRMKLLPFECLSSKTEDHLLSFRAVMKKFSKCITGLFPLGKTSLTFQAALVV